MAHKSKFARVLSVILSAVIAVSMMPMTVFADTGTGAGTGTGGGSGDAKEARLKEGQRDVSEDVDFFVDQNVDISFAWQCRMATNYANRLYSAGAKLAEAHYPDAAYKMANCGPWFAYSEGEPNTFTTNSGSSARGSKNSASSVSYAYSEFNCFNSLSNDDTGLPDNVGSAGDYAAYGRFLALTGLDSVGAANEGAERGLFGMIALVSYYAASSVNTLFELMYDALIATNPFQFFGQVFDSTNANNAMNTITTMSQDKQKGDTQNAFKELATFFSKIFKTFLSFAWAVAMPLSLVFIIVAYFLTKRGRMSAASNLKKFCIRAVFLCIGIPLLGSAYTQVLDALKSTQARTGDFIAQAVSYTFVDFGAWVDTSRLNPGNSTAGGGALEPVKPPSSGEGSGVAGTVYTLVDGITSSGGTVSHNIMPSGATWMRLRAISADLNNANGIIKAPAAGTASLLKISDKTGTMLRDYSNVNSMAIKDTSSQTKADKHKAVTDMLSKYMRGEKYSASTYENKVISTLAGTDYYNTFVLACHKYSFSTQSDILVKYVAKEDSWAGESKGASDGKKYDEVAKARFNGTAGSNTTAAKIWNNGAMTASGGGANITFNAGGTGGGTKGAISPNETVGLSTMSMYVYLTSSFDQDNVVVYGGAPSVYTQREHYQVNLIGGNYIMRFAFLSNMVALLLGYFLLAGFFIFRTIFEVIVKGFELLANSLLAAAGFYKSIGKCICLTVAMIAEVLVTTIFFAFIVDIMFALNSVCDYFFSELFNSVFNTNTSAAMSPSSPTASYIAELLVIFGAILSTFAIVFFVSFAIRWRGYIINSMCSAIESMVGTLMGTNLSGASSGMAAAATGALGTVAQVATAGAGLAATGMAVSETGSMVSDVRDAAADLTSGDATNAVIKDGENGEDAEKPDKDVNAVDASVNPSEGADFDGGNAADDNIDEDTKAMGEDALLNGLGNSDTIVNEDGTYTDPYGTFGNSRGTVNGNNSGSKDKESEKESKLNETDKSENSNETNEKEGLDKTNPVLSRNGNSNDNSNSSDSENESGDDGLLLIGGKNKTAGNNAAAEENDESSSSSDSDASSGGDNTSSGSDNTSDASATDAVDNTPAEFENTMTQDDDGNPLWEMKNPETGTTTAAKFDAERGLVLGITDADGNVSDVAIGANGISVGTTDADGNEKVITAGEEGFTSEFTGADGSTETVEINKDGLNSGMTVTRTDADGATEVTKAGLDGVTTTKTETGADGTTRTETYDQTTGALTVEEENATTGYKSTETIGADGTSVKTENVNGIQTVTETDTEGNITSQSVTRMGEDGSPITETYSVDQETGAVTESVTAHGVTNSKTTDLDGNVTTTQSVVNDKGGVTDVITEYGTDNVADKTTTVVHDAQGNVIASAERENISGVNENGESYTGYTEISTDGNKIEHRQYANGTVESFETFADGDTTRTVDDGKNVATYDFDAQTGNTTETVIDSHQNAKITTRNSTGDVIGEGSFDSNGYGTMTLATEDGGEQVTKVTKNGTTVADYDAGGNQTGKTEFKMTGDDLVATYYAGGTKSGSVVFNSDGTTEMKGFENGNVPDISEITNPNGTKGFTVANIPGMDNVAQVNIGESGFEMQMSGGNQGAGFESSAVFAAGTVTAAAVGAGMTNGKYVHADVDGVDTTGYVSDNNTSVNLTSAVGDNGNRQRVVSQGYSGGGTSYMATDVKDGSVQYQEYDSVGNHSTSYATKDGSYQSTYTSIAGNASTASYDAASKSYNEHTIFADGSTSDLSRVEEKGNVIETSMHSSVMGGGSTTQSINGQVTSVYESNASGGSFYQEATANGIVTREIRDNGDVINRTQQSGGDYVEETVFATGGKRIVSMEDGKLTEREFSATGLETTAMFNGSANQDVMQHVKYDAFTVQSGFNPATGEMSQVYDMGNGIKMTYAGDGNGVNKMTFTPGDAVYGSYTQAPDGNMNIVSLPNGFTRVENMSPNGQPVVTYLDQNNNPVAPPTDANSYVDAYASALNAMNEGTSGGDNILKPNFINPFNQGSLDNTTDNATGNASVEGSNLNIQFTPSSGRRKSGISRLAQKLSNKVQNAFQDDDNDGIANVFDTDYIAQNSPSRKLSGKPEDKNLVRKPNDSGYMGEVPTDKGGSTTGTK